MGEAARDGLGTALVQRALAAAPKKQNKKALPNTATETAKQQAQVSVVLAIRAVVAGMQLAADRLSL